MSTPPTAAPTPADRDAFEARLRAEGYDEIVSKSMGPDTFVPDHTHPFDVLGMVLEGGVTIDCGQGPRAYRPGETFEVARGVVHSERYGSDGYGFVAGRRHAPR